MTWNLQMGRVRNPLKPDIPKSHLFSLFDVLFCVVCKSEAKEISKFLWGKGVLCCNLDALTSLP